ncbi:hypothetical protein [Paraburkholderia tagetis]|uniref:TnsA endonuclease N terminal n=1 Tax=Paraburkholderia tagetis TaxID=2913261 RepID=A0A9X1UMR3_9BURK|nr:hypothetical protein [Paraburkholderia tagetis]MCG5078267.1 hypothetical protein [Paraburkholderia tagetis]
MSIFFGDAAEMDLRVPKKGREMPFPSKRKKKTIAPDVSVALEWDNLESLPADRERKLPARTIVTSTPYRIVGGFSLPSRSPWPLEWESYGERMTLATLALSQGLDFVATQPDELRYHLDGIPRRYYPDLLVRGPLGECFVEVKPLPILVKDENVQRYAEVAARLMAVGKRLEFLTDDQIIIKPRVANVSLLRRYISSHLEATEVPPVFRLPKAPGYAAVSLVRRATSQSCMNWVGDMKPSDE